MYYKDKTDTFKFRVSPLFLKALEIKAKQLNCSKSECVQKLLMPYLSEIMCDIREKDRNDNQEANFYD